MARIRVHQLAKELNVNNKDLIDRILKLGITVKNHMSTLPESSVQMIRQHFTEATREEVVEKRIGRRIIRRRKRVTLEDIPAPRAEAADASTAGPAEQRGAEPPPVAGPSPETPPMPATGAEPPPELMAETAEMHPEPSAAAPPAAGLSPEPEAPAVEPTTAGIPSPPTPETAPEPTAEAAVEPTLEAQREDTVSLGAVADALEAELSADALASGAVAEAPTAAPGELPPAPEGVEPTAEAQALESTAEAAAEPEAWKPRLVEPVRPEIEPEQVEEAEVTVPPSEELEEDEDKPKAKKARKRRRKKGRKDEPARIIKLPDIIPDEPEDEAASPSPAVMRLGAEADEKGTKEPVRKRRPKTDAVIEGAPATHRRSTSRKEVIERENLYTKKELAAQADRKRFRGRDRDAAFREGLKPEITTPKPGKRKIKMDEVITVANLAKQMGVKANEVIKKMLLLGVPANLNQALDFETAAVVASEFDFELENVGFEEDEFLVAQEDDPKDLKPRSPVITVMGHVDHGKTSLLDAIRHTNVIEGEAGGITQHIGAYFVKLENGEVVFLDTPGHEAFTSMRARGAQVTDIVILLVAADDGVMQQTVEAINHARAAEVPIIVAINKIDKPNANVERVKRQLAEQGLVPGEWGGDTTMVEVSAKKQIGIEELLEMVLLQAEIMELKANPGKPARGRVIEAKLDKGRGAVATILIQEGTLKTGDFYVCGTHSGRVRNMFNDRGQMMEEAGPSMPIEVLGISGVPNAGDDFVVLNEKQAKQVAEHRLLRQREKDLSKRTKITLERLYEQIKEGEIKEVNVVLKADVHGSLEAITDALRKLATSEVKVNVIHSGTGAVSETDIMLASASNAIVIAFNVRAEPKVQEVADQEQVDLRYYEVIYQILSDIRDAMEGMLEPIYKENMLGRAEVRETFHVPKVGTVAGCYVLDGRVERGAKVRLLRDHVVIYDGKVSSLRRFKDDAKEVKAGFECGMGLDNYNDIKLGDIFEVYELQAVKATLDMPLEPVQNGPSA